MTTTLMRELKHARQLAIERGQLPQSPSHERQMQENDVARGKHDTVYQQRDAHRAS